MRVSLLLLGLFGAASIACSAKPPSDSRPAIATSNEGFGPSTPSAPVGERLLDTTTPARTPAPVPTALARAVPSAFTPAPVTTFAPARSRNKPGSDENLPKWVPVRGRLSVVEVPDLAENLGLAPKGSTKSAETRVTVADALAQRTPPATTTTSAQAGAGSSTSATWLASNGRFRHGRGR
jgi:hypothetical protein